MIKKLLLKMLLKNSDQILAMAIDSLVKNYFKNKEDMLRQVMAGVKQSPLKETATPNEMNEVADSIEAFLAAQGDSDEFKRVATALKAIFEK